MSSFLRPLAYRHRWIYDTVTAVSSLSVGGVERLRSLGLDVLRDRLPTGAAVLDLCCGSGEAAAPWLAAGFAVTGLDISPRAGRWLRLPQQLFCALFETDTATAMLEDDLPCQLRQLGFTDVKQELLAGNALQRITAQRPST